MTKQDYINRVQKGIEVYAAMEELKHDEELTIEFGNRGEFKIQCHEIELPSGTKRNYSISDDQMFGKSMNIDMEKSGKSYLSCYAYDLFSNETTAKLYFEHITIK